MSVTDAILENVSKVFGKMFGTANDRELKRLWPYVEAVNAAWPAIRTLTNEQLRAKTDEFRVRLLQGETEDGILPEAFSVCREAAHRTMGEGKMVREKYERIRFVNGKFEYTPEEGEIPYFAHFDVQILGGVVLHDGKIAEMVTGEGKTLVATLPCYLNALRPDAKWVAKAKELQGEDMRTWDFRPYGLFRTEDGAEEWRLLDRLLPDPEDMTQRMPTDYIPLTRGIHVVTVNDYLAGRDAQDNRTLFDFLGVTVGAIQSNMGSQERKPVYSCDIVYGTNNEFGFDYLRDNLKVRVGDQVQRSRFFAIVDEVDSVLIDEARTPLIISGSAHESSDKYLLADRVARQLKGMDGNTHEEKIAKLMKQGMQREDARMAAEEDADFVYSERDHTAKLTERGMHKALRILGMDDIYSGANMDMPHFLDNALRAHSLYKKDVQYIVRDGQVYIVDEFTGRVLEGRRWSDGLHQAVEAKEGLRIKEESQTIATITFQNFFRLYDRLGGMTGTAMTEAKEFMSTYGLGVVCIPTNRPLRRVNYPDLIYGTAKEKYIAIADHVTEIHKTGRPILIGTVSIEHSELISEMLKHRGVKHEVLNAKYHQREAEIVSLAGQLGQVTVATNMAGRGTDIRLGQIERGTLLDHWKRFGLCPRKGVEASMDTSHIEKLLLETWVDYYLKGEAGDFASRTPEAWWKRLEEEWASWGISGPKFVEHVADLGGLHIVGTERHEARRIDNQLRGRSGRQGDPGSSRFFLSLEDDTMRLFAPERARQFMQWAGLKDGMPIESGMVSRSVEKAQRKVEERNFEVRKNLLEYDKVNNDQRHVIYGKRQAWLEGRELRESMLEFCAGHIAVRVPEYLNADEEDPWNIPAICNFMDDAFYIRVKPEDIEACRDRPNPEDVVLDLLQTRLAEAYERHETEIGEASMRLLEKLVLLETVDRKWMDHLYAMDLMKDGIHLWGYAGQDPKIRYRREAFDLFDEMWASLQAEVAELILKVRPVEQMQIEEQVEIQNTIHGDFDALAESADQAGAHAGAEDFRPQPIRNTSMKVGGNDPCPCGSGKKHKKCCGRNT